MNLRVQHAWLYLLFGLLTARWWTAALTTLVADVRAAGAEAPLPRPVPVRVDRRAAPARLPEHGRVPPTRVLAFRGVARRVAARSRWEAGFGRRGL